jgi:O-antigen/teichoic acid export membrane protein
MATALNFVVQMGASLIVTPIIVHGLGRNLYGAWMMIQQTIGYIALVDLRATGTAKFTLAVDQHNTNIHYKRQQVGASLMMLARVAPFVVIIGLAAVWCAPWLIRTEPESASRVRWALAVGIVGILVGELGSIPGNILRGVNMEYKGMGLTTISAVASCSLAVVAIWLEYGVIGLVAAGVAGQAISGGIRFAIARAHVPWFGYEWPDQTTFRIFRGTTIWIFLASFGYLLQNATDILLVGYLFGPSVAAIYGTTGSVLRMGSGILFSVVGAANPGIAGLCGRRDWGRVQQVRNEMHLIALVSMVVLGVGILALNRSFITLWLGPVYYGGNILNLLLVVSVIISAPLRLDAAILDGMLMFRERAISAISTSVFGLLLGTFLGQKYGIEGIVLGVIVGYICAVVIYWWIIEQKTPLRNGMYIRWILRPSLVGLALMGLSHAGTVSRLGVMQFIATAVVIGLGAMLLMSLCGLNATHRAVLGRRYAKQLAVLRMLVPVNGQR